MTNDNNEKTNNDTTTPKKANNLSKYWSTILSIGLAEKAEAEAAKKNSESTDSDN